MDPMYEHKVRKQDLHLQAANYQLEKAARAHTRALRAAQTNKPAGLSLNHVVQMLLVMLP